MSNQKAWWHTIIVGSSVAIGLAAIIFMNLNRPGGPVTQIIGVVQSSAFLPANDVRPPSQMVSLRLANGEVVLARSDTSFVANPSDLVRLNVYQATITGAKSYQVVRIEPKQNLTPQMLFAYFIGRQKQRPQSQYFNSHVLPANPAHSR